MSTSVGYDDMIKMDNLTSDTILENLKARFDANLIYVRAKKKIKIIQSHFKLKNLLFEWR